jgi:hypothetical protein
VGRRQQQLQQLHIDDPLDVIRTLPVPKFPPLASTAPKGMLEGPHPGAARGARARHIGADGAGAPVHGALYQRPAALVHVDVGQVAAAAGWHIAGRTINGGRLLPPCVASVSVTAHQESVSSAGRLGLSSPKNVSNIRKFL